MTASFSANVPHWTHCRSVLPMAQKVQLEFEVPKWFSQMGEDKFAYNNFFHKMFSGSYLEVGGLDGVRYSNTLSFHKHLGWRGVLIEASLDEYRQLIKNRPDDICIHAAVCKQPQVVHYTTHKDSAVNGIYEFMSEGFKKYWHPNVSISQLPQVTCAPLTNLLSKFGMHEFDFFSLDVEGAELPILESIDFVTTKFKVLAVETGGRPPEITTRISTILNRHGYKQHIGTSNLSTPYPHNTWFVHEHYSPSSCV